MFFLHFLNTADHRVPPHFCQRELAPLNSVGLGCRSRAELAPICFKLMRLPLPFTRTASVPRKKKKRWILVTLAIPYRYCPWPSWWSLGRHPGSHQRLTRAGAKRCAPARGGTEWALPVADTVGRGTSTTSGRQPQRSLGERSTGAKSFSVHSRCGVYREAESERYTLGGGWWSSSQAILLKGACSWTAISKGTSSPGDHCPTQASWVAGCWQRRAMSIG